jgi:hypothetical protein
MVNVHTTQNSIAVTELTMLNRKEVFCEVLEQEMH